MNRNKKERRRNWMIKAKLRRRRGQRKERNVDHIKFKRRDQQVLDEVHPERRRRMSECVCGTSCSLTTWRETKRSVKLVRIIIIRTTIREKLWAVSLLFKNLCSSLQTWWKLLKPAQNVSEQESAECEEKPTHRCALWGSQTTCAVSMCVQAAWNTEPDTWRQQGRGCSLIAAVLAGRGPALMRLQPACGDVTDSADWRSTQEMETDTGSCAESHCRMHVWEIVHVPGS